MTSRLKLRLASNPSAKPAQIKRAPRMMRPANPRRTNSNIGNMPRRKIGSSGSSNNVSDCLRIGRPIGTATSPILVPVFAPKQGERAGSADRRQPAAISERISARSSPPNSAAYRNVGMCHERAVGAAQMIETVRARQHIGSRCRASVPYGLVRLSSRRRSCTPQERTRRYAPRACQSLHPES
jgi:hypothetical protein